MGSWLCLHCEDSVLLLHLAAGLHCPAPALESDCGVLVTHLGSVSWVSGLGLDLCLCVWDLEALWVWLRVLGLCLGSACSSGSRICCMEPGVSVLCQSLVSSVWHSGLMVLPGSWGQFGIGAEVWGSTFGSGSAPGYRFWTLGLCSCYRTDRAGG